MICAGTDTQDAFSASMLSRQKIPRLCCTCSRVLFTRLRLRGLSGCEIRKAAFKTDSWMPVAIVISVGCLTMSHYAEASGGGVERIAAEVSCGGLPRADMAALVFSAVRYSRRPVSRKVPKNCTAISSPRAAFTLVAPGQPSSGCLGRCQIGARSPSSRLLQVQHAMTVRVDVPPQTPTRTAVRKWAPRSNPDVVAGQEIAIADRVRTNVAWKSHWAEASREGGSGRNRPAVMPACASLPRFLRGISILYGEPGSVVPSATRAQQQPFAFFLEDFRDFLVEVVSVVMEGAAPPPSSASISSCVMLPPWASFAKVASSMLKTAGCW